MSAPDTTAPAAASKSILPGQTLIRGRCQAVRSFQTQSGKLWAHLVVMPAPDSYSHPATVEVVARNRLADRDQDFSALCAVGGVRSSFASTDKDTGETKTIVTAQVRLTAVE